MKASDDDMLTPADITREYRIGRKAVYRLLREGDIPSLLIGRTRRLVPRYVIRQWIRDNVTASATSGVNSNDPMSYSQHVRE